MFGVSRGVRETSGGIQRSRSMGGVALGSVAVVLSLLAAGCSGGGQGAQEPTPGSQDQPVGVSPPDAPPPLTGEQLTEQYESMSRPAKPGKPINLGSPTPPPVVAPQGGLTVSAYIKKPGGSPSVETRTLPEGATREQTQAALDELRAIPGAQVVDWSLPPTLKSATPNDPRWNPNPAKPNLAVPFARIGLCCSNDGMVDGWDISSRLYANANPKPADVNIAIIDSGLVKVRAGVAMDLDPVIEADLKNRFLGTWDKSNSITGGVVDLAIANTPYSWAASPPLTLDQHHGTDVAGYALGIANNKQGIAGAAGNLPNVKFGMFRHRDMGGIPTTLSLILQQVTAYQGGKLAGGRNWQVINMSLGSPGPNAVQAKLVEDLALRGVLVVSAASNERTSFDQSSNFYKPGTNTIQHNATYGKNPVEWPGASPSGLSVASWGKSPSSPNDTKMYGEETSDYSSYNPHVSITAPGTALPGVTEAGLPDEYSKASGTSYASPTLAGIAASLISISGNKYRCTDKPTGPDRWKCLGELRANLLGSTSDVTGKSENPFMQGAGVIDVPRAFLGAPAITVPDQPVALAGTLTVTKSTPAVGGNPATFDYTLKPTWTAAGLVPPKGWKPTDITLAYQPYLDGDLTRKVEPNELKAALDKPDTNMPSKDKVTGNWSVPKDWVDYRITIPRVTGGLPGTEFNRQGAIAPIGGIAIVTVRFAVTTVATYTVAGKARRQTESLPATLECPVTAAHVAGLAQNLACTLVAPP